MIYATIRIDILHDETLTRDEIEHRIKQQALRWGKMIRRLPHTRKPMRAEYRSHAMIYYMEVGYK